MLTRTPSQKAFALPRITLLLALLATLAYLHVSSTLCILTEALPLPEAPVYSLVNGLKSTTDELLSPALKGAEHVRPLLSPTSSSSSVDSVSSSGKSVSSSSSVESLSSEMSAVPHGISKSSQLYKEGKISWQALQAAREDAFVWKAVTKQSDQLRIATANVAKFKQPAKVQGTASASTFKDSLHKFRQMDADVLAIQEFVRPSSKADIELWNTFLKDMGYRQVIQKSNLPFRIVDKREQVILSRLQVVKSDVGRTWRLPFMRGTRSYVLAEVEKDGKRVLVATTHGTFGASNGAARTSQFSSITENKLWQNSQSQKVMTGDFNEHQGGVHKVLTDKGMTDSAAVPKSPRAAAEDNPEVVDNEWTRSTYWRGGTPIDANYATAGLNKAFDRQTNVPSSLSDHNPIMTDFDLSKLAPAGTEATTRATTQATTQSGAPSTNAILAGGATLVGTGVIVAGVDSAHKQAAPAA